MEIVDATTTISLSKELSLFKYFSKFIHPLSSTESISSFAFSSLKSSSGWKGLGEMNSLLPKVFFLFQYCYEEFTSLQNKMLVRDKLSEFDSLWLTLINYL